MGLALSTNELVLLNLDGENELWRVLAIAGDCVVAAKTALDAKAPEKTRADSIAKSKLHVRSWTTAEIDDLHREGKASIASVTVGPAWKPIERETGVQKAVQRRIEIMTGFLDAASLQRSLAIAGSFSPLVREAAMKASMLAEMPGDKSAESTDDFTREKEAWLKYKPIVYQWLKLLITFGFVSQSLHTLHENCGAKGKPRIYGGQSGKARAGARNESERLQLGAAVTTCIDLDQRVEIAAIARGILATGQSMARAIAQVKLVKYAKKVEPENGKWKMILPEPGFYPNDDQIRWVIESEIGRLDRLIIKTSAGHFAKNHRALRGTARDGVLGAGHKYFIDSTIADVFLRSGIDLRWLVGRPIVYWVQDAWSTAIVGLYACLHSPSWESAACAVFLSTVGSDDFEALMGVGRDLGLSLAPAVCAELSADRGEYLSAAARAAALMIGTSLIYGPSYRADLRGMVERFHRIPKDYSFGFLPGSFDARNAELEKNKSTYGAAVLTLPEYYTFLLNIARAHNLTANREKIAPAELLADGFPCTPAGMWAWSHHVGTGYRKVVDRDTLVRGLLRPCPVVIRRNGAHMGQIRYESDPIERLVAESRNFGFQQAEGFILPARPRQIYLTVPGERTLQPLRMADGQQISSASSIFDLLDHGSAKRLNRTQQAHNASAESVNALAQNTALLAQSEDRLAATSVGVKAARDAEHQLHLNIGPPKGTTTEPEPTRNDHLPSLDELMRAELEAA